MLRTFKVLLIALVVIIIAGAAYAFAASNTMPAYTNAGVGVSSVSGYTVSNVAYHFVAGDPTQIENITFTLDQNAGTVKIQLDDTAVTGDVDWDWTTCAEDAPAGSKNWTCTPGGTLNTSAILDFNVAATSN